MGGGTFLVPSGSYGQRDTINSVAIVKEPIVLRRTFSATSGLRSAAQCITPVNGEDEEKRVGKFFAVFSPMA